MGRQADEELAEAFWAVARRLRHATAHALEPWDIAPSHSRALRVLMEHGTMRLSDLSAHLRIAPRSTTEVVDALQERELLERRPDPDDRRATLVALTARGTELGATIDAARRAEAVRFFADLDPADRDELSRILGRLRERPVSRRRAEDAER